MNPASGGGAAPEAVVPVARRLRDHGARVEVTYSPGPEACPALVAEAVARGDVVVSVGGDGMLSSLAGAVSQLGGTLGIVPAGRGNDFARMLGMPSDPLAQADVLLAGKRRTVDLIAYGDRLVAGSVYAGVDARAAEIVDSARFVPKIAQYPLAALRALATYTPARYQLTIDGAAHEFNGATVVVANSGYYGKGMKIAPAAVARRRAARHHRDRGRVPARADAVAAQGVRRRARRPRRGARLHRPLGDAQPRRRAARSRSAATARGSACCPLPAAPATVSVRPGALTVIA